MTDVNFDEFQAIRRRKAQDDEEDEDTKEEPAAPPKAEEDEEPDGLAERAGAFAELPEVQLLLCVAILADVAGAAVTAARDGGAPAFLVRAAAAFPGFVNFLYAFELLALATAFKLRMLTHPGLLLDVGIVSARHRRPMVYCRVDGVFGQRFGPGRLPCRRLDAVNWAPPVLDAIDAVCLDAVDAAPTVWNPSTWLRRHRVRD